MVLERVVATLENVLEILFKAVARDSSTSLSRSVIKEMEDESDVSITDIAKSAAERERSVATR